MSAHAVSQQTPSTQNPLVHAGPSAVHGSPFASVSGGGCSTAASMTAASASASSPPLPPVPGSIAFVRAHDAAARPHNATPRTNALENADDRLRMKPALFLARTQSVTNRSPASIQRRVTSANSPRRRAR